MGCFPTDVLFSRVNIGTVGQVVCGFSKYLQRFSSVLDTSSELSMECFCQVVVTVVVFEHRSNHFVCHPTGDTM
jgi:hypothetical protein